MLRKEIIETWKNGDRKLKDNTIKRYLRGLDNIYKDCEKLNDTFDNTDGLFLVKTLLEQISKKDIRKQKGDLGHIMSALTPKGKFYFENEKHAVIYKEYLDYYNTIKEKCEEEDKKQLKIIFIIIIFLIFFIFIIILIIIIFIILFVLNP